MMLAGLATSVAATAGGVASPAARRSAAPSRYAGAIEALSSHVEREIAFWGLPGITIALADGDGYAEVLTFGLSDVERNRPVTPSQLFLIGSISKSIAAVTLLTFVDEKRLDLEAPLAHYLPDLPLRSRWPRCSATRPAFQAMRPFSRRNCVPYWYVKTQYEQLNRRGCHRRSYHGGSGKDCRERRVHTRRLSGLLLLGEVVKPVGNCPSGVGASGKPGAVQAFRFIVG